MRTKVQAHVAYQTQYHVVWIPKRRRKLLVDGVEACAMKTLYSSIEQQYPDVYISVLNVQVDHLHALIERSPKYCVSTVGINETIIRGYMQYQDKQEYGQAELASR